MLYQPAGGVLEFPVKPKQNAGGSTSQDAPPVPPSQNTELPPYFNSNPPPLNYGVMLQTQTDIFAGMLSLIKHNVAKSSLRNNEKGHVCKQADLYFGKKSTKGRKIAFVKFCKGHETYKYPVDEAVFIFFYYCNFFKNLLNFYKSCVVSGQNLLTKASMFNFKTTEQTIMDLAGVFAKLELGENGALPKDDHINIEKSFSDTSALVAQKVWEVAYRIFIRPLQDSKITAFMPWTILTMEEPQKEKTGGSATQFKKTDWLKIAVRTNQSIKEAMSFAFLQESTEANKDKKSERSGVPQMMRSLMNCPPLLIVQTEPDGSIDGQNSGGMIDETLDVTPYVLSAREGLDPSSINSLYAAAQESPAGEPKSVAQIIGSLPSKANKETGQYKLMGVINKVAARRNYVLYMRNPESGRENTWCLFDGDALTPDKTINDVQEAARIVSKDKGARVLFYAREDCIGQLFG
jgi:hypothetical protein